jgi:hypothetical protein
MLLGKLAFVGVAGRTLTLACGDFVLFGPEMDIAGDVMDAEDDTELALECVWWWCGIDRMLETEEDVDLRPRRPPDERR